MEPSSHSKFSEKSKQRSFAQNLMNEGMIQAIEEDKNELLESRYTPIN